MNLTDLGSVYTNVFSPCPLLWVIYTARFGLGFRLRFGLQTQLAIATLHYAEVFTLHRFRFRFQS